MKRAARLVGGGFLGLIGCLAYFVAGIGALGIHLYATWYAYESSGFIAAVAGAAGSWWNMYTAAIVLIIVCYAIMSGAFGLIGREEQ
jgi:hypothetical protein